MIRSTIKPVALAAALSASLSACSVMPMSIHTEAHRAAQAGAGSVSVHQQYVVVRAQTFNSFVRQAVTLYKYPIHDQYLDLVCAQRRAGGPLQVLTMPNRARSLEGSGYYRKLPAASSCKELVDKVRVRFHAGSWWMPGFVQL